MRRAVSRLSGTSRVLPVSVPAPGPRHPRCLLRLSLPFRSQAGCLHEQTFHVDGAGVAGWVADAVSFLLRCLRLAVAMPSGVSVGAAPALSAPCTGAGFRDACGGLFAASLHGTPGWLALSACPARSSGSQARRPCPPLPAPRVGFSDSVSLAPLSFLLVPLCCSLSVWTDLQTPAAP